MMKLPYFGPSTLAASRAVLPLFNDMLQRRLPIETAIGADRATREAFRRDYVKAFCGFLVREATEADAPTEAAVRHLAKSVDAILTRLLNLLLLPSVDDRDRTGQYRVARYVRRRIDTPNYRGESFSDLLHQLEGLGDFCLTRHSQLPQLTVDQLTPTGNSFTRFGTRIGNLASDLLESLQFPTNVTVGKNLSEGHAAARQIARFYEARVDSSADHLTARLRVLQDIVAEHSVRTAAPQQPDMAELRPAGPERAGATDAPATVAVRTQSSLQTPGVEPRKPVRGRYGTMLDPSQRQRVKRPFQYGNFNCFETPTAALFKRLAVLARRYKLKTDPKSEYVEMILGTMGEIRTELNLQRFGRGLSDRTCSRYLKDSTALVEDATTRPDRGNP